LPSVLSGTRACHLQVLAALSCMTSAVAAQLWAPKNAYRAPLMVISKKRLRRCFTSRGRMALATKYLNFYFFLFHYFLVPLANPISAEPSPESLPLGGFMFVQGD